MIPKLEQTRRPSCCARLRQQFKGLDSCGLLSEGVAVTPDVPTAPGVLARWYADLKPVSRSKVASGIQRIRF